MTLDDKLSQGAVLVTDAWESLADTWVQAAQELLHSLTADPFGLFHPAFVADQVFDLAGRSFEISLNLISDLTGASTGEPAVEHATEAGNASIALAPPLEAIQPEVIDPPAAIAPPAVIDPPEVIDADPPAVIHIPPAPKPARPVAADRYSRLSKADLQKTLSSRHLPKTGTVKELRQRLIEADRTADR